MVIDENEQTLIGQIFMDSKQVLPQVRGIVRVEDFIDPSAREAYRAACELADEGVADTDPYAVQRRVEKNGHTIANNYLRDALRSVVTLTTCHSCAESIHDAAAKRTVRDVGLELAEGSLTATEAIAKLQSLQTGAAAPAMTSQEAALRSYQRLVDIAEGKADPVLPTGFPTLDKALDGGFPKTGLVTLAARPRIGKSMVAINIAENIAKAGHRVLYVSLEMSEAQVMSRRLGREVGKSSSDILHGKIKDDPKAWQLVAQAHITLSSRPFDMSFCPLTFADLEAKARAVPDLEFLVLDQFSLLRPSNPKETEFARLTANSKALKSLSSSLGICVLNLAQINRQFESRQDSNPRLSDLKGTGSLEEDADLVLLLNRDIPESGTPGYASQELSVDIAKYRDGAQSTISLEFRGMTSTIADRGNAA